MTCISLVETDFVFSRLRCRNWNVSFTNIRDFDKFQKVRCIGYQTFLVNPQNLFIFAMYITLSCQISNIVITLVVLMTHQ